ncbi:MULTISPECIES: type II toxin-antitoxin system VapC family toxin [Rhizobium]|uniref:PilT protein domain protein n=1 Tax=Rhizobium leguminosarum bv. trifolii (strain WSM1325) TaxID=395491 RepID=C6ASK7_RHILS|nr:type II toxin-antitoxin system VapC family toxin [Rhizobium leguminosarum]ACS57254.1 PilT protein domain protein [Rhizobium leguminosarum bv. trifolii WSM1325]MBY2913008.1 type II toxin-antitoxin system VapC family toxin [Rhizobium leguminosarum]MBY2968665.1 type II toxin-antitoxin system VapC family toxin [Rhizobium leguminosarum]MBY2976039.1 type II toxin-antitoxin system VapC family toxin [Rhizobium leguminosarum]MBY2997529.1 type II toxin-antitoxin system VapC family toxin [Rhizobium le
MRVLLDTHMIIAIVQRKLTDRFPDVQRVLLHATTKGFVSVASLWEIAIKTRLGKLQPGLTLDVIPAYLQGTGLTILPIDIAHVITAADPDPETRDPFDRLLLAQCKVEGLQLATVDRLLVDHPLALRL